MVNQRFNCAVHIMTALAFHREQMGSRSLALSINTNPVVVRRLVLALRDAGLVKTSVGRCGGARLAIPARRITLLNIYHAIEPRPVIPMGKRKPWRHCPVSCNMKFVMSPVVAAVEKAVRRRLREISLEQLVHAIERNQE